MSDRDFRRSLRTNGSPSGRVGDVRPTASFEQRERGPFVLAKHVRKGFVHVHKVGRRHVPDAAWLRHRSVLGADTLDDALIDSILVISETEDEEAP